MSTTGTIATGALMVASAGLAAYGLAEVGSGLLHTFNSTSSAQTQMAIEAAGAGMGALVGGAGLTAIGFKTLCGEGGGFLRSIGMGIAGALLGGIGGWNIAAANLPHHDGKSSPTIVQPLQQKNASRLPAMP